MLPADEGPFGNVTLWKKRILHRWYMG